MRGQPSNNTAKSDRFSFLWLGIGTLLLVFANGRWIFPLTTWLALIFVMRFLRKQKAARGLIIVSVAFLLVNIISWQGMIPVSSVIYYAIAAGIAGTYLLPFLADRLIVPRVNGFASTLVFPLVWTTVEYLNSVVNPYATWCALAYTQYGCLPLVQLVSVTGLSGLTFLITWFASVVNWIWEEDFRWPKIRPGIGIYAGILAGILLLGGARMVLFPSRSNTVRVGSVTASQILVSQFRQCVEKADWECVHKTSVELLDVLIEDSRLAAHAGAKIVFWQEYAGRMLMEDEEVSIERGKELARKENIYLGMALFTMTRAYPDELGENKIIWIAPSGEVIAEYLKSRPVPGEPCIAGEGNIPVFDTPYGKIASVICYDMDFPGLVRQAGQAGADLMLVPAEDWKEVNLLHSHMAIFRAIENGFSLVRSTDQGMSVASDFQGQILAALNQLTTEERLMITDVPTRGVTTFYSRIGDLFAWLCIAGFLTITGWTVFHMSIHFKTRGESMKINN